MGEGSVVSKQNKEKHQIIIETLYKTKSGQNMIKVKKIKQTQSFHISYMVVLSMKENGL